MSATTAQYQELVTSQHANKPKFMAMVAAATQGMVDLQNFLATLPGEFDVDSARWEELDALGRWVGLDRNLRANDPGAYVQVAPAGAAPMSDNDFSVLIRGKISANRWLGSVASALDLFPGTGAFTFVVDHQDMTMTVAVAGAVLDYSMRQALACGYMGVRPCGVLSDYTFTSDSGPIFGFDVENQFISGFDVGAWGVPA